jgi:hypothetical protein
MRNVLLLCGVLALGGCAGAAWVEPPNYALGYTPGEERVQGMQMPVIVGGNPFAMPQADFANAVTDAMQGWAFRAPLRFTAAGNPTATYRVIMMFNPPRNSSDFQYCERPLPIQPVFGVAPNAPRTPVFAVLCRGDGVLASARGSLSTADGPQGPNFRAGVGQFTGALFPPSNPEAKPDRCGSGFDC